jgi:N-succinyldiaminopimelate aminotransferase
VEGRNPFLVDRMQGFGTTIFAEMSALAAATGSINLGQGFPDTDGPPELVEAAIGAIRAGDNQYPPGPGIAPLREAVAEHQQRFWGLTFDPDTEVLVTAGATEAIAAALLALLEVGDEVVVFEPYYDSYAASIALAGAQRRCVTLRPPDYAFSLDQLRAAITARTRVVLLNSPHNPTGKVFTQAELEAIAALCVEHDLVAVTDEVYEHLVYDDAVHVPIATLPGMRDRTVTISSVGKSFSMTGWKTGWACGHPDLIGAIRTVKQFLTYVHGAPFQHAAAAGLRLPDAYFTDLAADLAARRDLLSNGLADAGFAVHPPSGTYFVTADIRPLGETDGLAFCRALPERCGVVGVPTVVFYDDVEVGAPLVRFMFGKRREVLEDAVVRLKGVGR